MTEKICGKCGGPLPGPMVISFCRSREWVASIKQREEVEDGVRVTDINLCEFCGRQFESILYNWFHNLPLDHNPFMM